MGKVLWRIIMAAASMSSMVGAGSADPYKWCAVESGGSTNCSFMTMDQCRATISGNGGSCEPKQILPTNLSPAARSAAPKIGHEWEQRQFIDGVRDKFLQDQLFSQDSETI